MSHQDAVFKIPKNFKNLASTNSSKYNVNAKYRQKNLWYSVSNSVTHTKKDLKF